VVKKCQGVLLSQGVTPRTWHNNESNRCLKKGKKEVAEEERETDEREKLTLKWTMARIT